MFRKTLIATSALVAASSVAFASQHVVLPKGQTMQSLMHKAMSKKMPGVIFSKNNTPVAIRAQIGKGHAVGHEAKFMPPGKINDFSKSKNSLYLSWFGWFGGANHIQYGPSTYSYCFEYSGNTCISGYYEKFSEKVNIAQSAAQPFTGAKSASSVSIAAAQYSGSGGASVSIYDDNNSAPGTKVAGGSFSTAPAFTGLCCSAVETVNFKPVSLNKKKQYWVVVSGNGSNGRVAWLGQSANWTAYPNGEDYNETGSTVVNLTYRTDCCGYHETIHTTYHSGTGGWIHTSSFTYEAQPGAFSVN
jgi:hypothetical protein